jgi:hypothetical protein
MPINGNSHAPLYLQGAIITDNGKHSKLLAARGASLHGPETVLTPTTNAESHYTPCDFSEKNSQI